MPQGRERPIAEMEPLEHYVNFVRDACAMSTASAETTEERVRFIEILWHHANSGWIKPEFLTRAANFICDPERWEEWKRRGGDTF